MAMLKPAWPSQLQRLLGYVDLRSRLSCGFQTLYAFCSVLRSATHTRITILYETRE